MKRFCAAILAIMVAFSASADIRRHQANLVIPSSYTASGVPVKTATSITNLLAQTSTMQMHYLFDGGVFTIDKSITWPSNVTVEVIEGSYFRMTNSAVMTFSGNQFIAGDYLVWTGATGTATGTARFPHRHDAWGPTNLYFIGNGSEGSQDLSAYYTSAQTDTAIGVQTALVYAAALAADGAGTFADLTAAINTYNNSTDQNMYDLTVRNDAEFRNDVQIDNDLVVLADSGMWNVTVSNNLVASNLVLNGESISSWDETATFLNTPTNVFAAYPQLTFTTNMVSYDHVATGSSLPITNSTFTNAFDWSTNTYTSIGNLDGGQSGGGSDLGWASYVIDLGDEYQGFFYVSMFCTPDQPYHLGFDIFAIQDPPTYGSEKGIEQGGWRGFDRNGRVDPYPRNAGKNTDNRSVAMIPFTGRYLCIALVDEDSAGVGNTYKFNVIKAWGVLTP